MTFLDTRTRTQHTKACAMLTSINLEAYYICEPAAVGKIFADREYTAKCYWQQVRRISFCWQEIRETFSALCFSSSRFAGASSRVDVREYAAGAFHDRSTKIMSS